MCVSIYVPKPKIEKIYIFFFENSKNKEQINAVQIGVNLRSRRKFEKSETKKFFRAKKENKKNIILNHLILFSIVCKTIMYFSNESLAMG